MAAQISRLALLVTTFALSVPVRIVGQTDTSPKPSKAHKPPKAVSEKELALEAVDSAVHVARQLTPELRGYLLAQAGGAVAGANPSKAIEYCTTAFDTAEEMALLDPYDLRIGVQEGVVAKLVRLNPDKAVELLMRADKPQWTGYPNDDPRSRSATLLTDRLLNRNGKKDIERVTELLEYLGATGKYPYRAASKLIEFFHLRRQEWRATDVFAQALAFFEKDDRFPSSPDEFAELVLSASKNVPGSSLVSAIRMIVDKARASEEKTAKTGDPAHPRFLMTVPNGTLPVSKKSTYLALKLLPLARKLDPSLASELEQHDPDLSGMVKSLSPEQLSSLSSGSLAILHGDSDPTSAQMQQFGQRVRDQQALKSIAEMSSNPDGALGLAANIQAPGARAEALALIASSLAKSDAHRARALVDDAETSLSKVDDDQQKVRAILPIALAWADLGNDEKGLSLLSTGYSLAAALYKSEEEGGATDEDLLLGPAARLFRSLIQVEAKIDASGAIARAQSRVSPLPLRAAVLIEAANVILNRHT